MPDTIVSPQASAPPDYPFDFCADQYSTQPFAADFAARRQAYLDFVRSNPAPSGPKAIWFELARVEAGGVPHTGVITAALDYIESRQDCADVCLAGVLRMLYQYPGHTALEPELLERARHVVLGFKYWPDEPGSDSMCTWTENHYILFASAAYLAGQLYPDQIFTNSGQTGEEKMAAFRPRLLKWMNLRFFTGFSEWLSNVYYDEDLTALLNLIDFCGAETSPPDEELRRRAAMLVDLLLFEMAANNFAGVFASSHGRSYEHNKKWAAQESTTDTQKLVFGRGIFAGQDNMSAAALALSPAYSLPQVIAAIANDQQRPELLHRQRMGICIDQADWWDLEPRDFESGMQLLTLEAYLHPLTANLFVKMLDAYDWWDNELFAPFRQRRGLLRTLRSVGLLPAISRRYARDVCRNTREEVNLYTYRTPDYMLSSAVDYRKGYGGDQQHIWQATLGPDAVCFTTHPARQQGQPPNYWTGSGSLPRVAQVKNVLIAIYRIEKFPALYLPNELFFTHAWLPRDHFEEVVESEGWIFARLGEGYLALLSEQPYEWHSMPGEDQGREIIVRKRNNIWLCELGRKTVDGSFEDFVKRILAAEVQYSGAGVSYHSPTQGHLRFSWNGPLRQEGREITLGDFPRYASPYVQAPFPPETIHISLGDQSLDLDWMACKRQASSYL